MREFETRWKQLCRHAAGPAAAESTAPTGFATRVVARALAQRPSAVEDVCLSFALRTLAAVGSLALVLAFFEWSYQHNASVLRPGVENTVAQVLWSL